MATRSYIIVHNPKDNRYYGAFCHFDGYIKCGVGEMLKTHYKSFGKAFELVNSCILKPNSKEVYFEDCNGNFFSERNGERKSIFNGKEIRDLGLTPDYIEGLKPTIEETDFVVNQKPRYDVFEAKDYDALISAIHRLNIAYYYLFKDKKWMVREAFTDPVFLEY